MKKILHIGVAILTLLLVISCEKDFREIGSNIISNTQFDTKQITLDVVVTPRDVSSVRADNLGTISRLGEYLLGVYNSGDYKKIEASIISQVGFQENPDIVGTVNTDTIDTYILDKVAVLIPYTSSLSYDDDLGEYVYELDSVLGNTTIGTSLKIYRNGTFLNTLDVDNPSQGASYFSDHEYVELDLLNADTDFEFIPNVNDTIFVIDRTVGDGGTFKDTISVSDNYEPFLTVELDKDKMQQLFWDKFSDTEFSNEDAFNSYFRGLILKSEGDDGALIPLSFSTNPPTLEFFYTMTREIRDEDSGELAITDTTATSFSFSLSSGVINSQYKMTTAENAAPSNSFVVQGTAGSIAQIDILNDAELSDLRSQDILINDVSVVFNIDASRDTTDLPRNLFLVKDNETSEGHIKDIYTESASFGGDLEYEYAEDTIPSKYTIRITDYVSDLINNETDYNPPLLLKVYNIDTDSPISSGVFDTIVSNYNWNPRGVTLYNHSSSNTENRAKLIISYSEEKESD